MFGTALFYAFIILFLGLGLGAIISDRVDMRIYRGDDGKPLYRALSVALPGYQEWVSPEHIVDLRGWAGTQAHGISAINKDDGTANPKATAGIALMSMGIYSPKNGYQLEQLEDGSVVLRKPEQRGPYFTLYKWRPIPFAPKVAVQ